MKKICTLMLLAAAACGTASAQYVSNGNFDGDWEDCHPWEKGNYLSNNVGVQPKGWRVSNVYNSIITLPLVAAKTDNNNGFAVKLTNQSTAGQNVPAYLELGTPWATAETKGTTVRNQDGGSFGGVSFAYKPDAVTVSYKRESTVNGDKLSVVAYLWKGTWSQADVPSNTATGIFSYGTATKVTMKDRDSNIMGKSHILGGTVTKSADAELIAALEEVNYDQNTEWKTLEIPFKYNNAEATPEKLNVIIANTDYFGGASQVVNKSTVTVDNVDVVYWNTLSSLKYDGTELLEGEETAYDMSSEVYDPAKLVATAKSQFGVASVSYDDATCVATITVTREHAEDKVYTIQFGEGKTGDDVTYTKDIIITINGESTAPQSADIVVTYYDDATIDFTLKNFCLGEGEGALPVGNIALTNLAISEGKFSFNDNLTIQPGDDEDIEWFGPLLGELPLNLTGEITDSDGFFYVNIDLDLSSIGQIINVQVGESVAAPLVISDAKTSTFVAPFAVTIPAEDEQHLFTASTVTGVDESGILQLVACTDVIPAQTPVVIQGEAADYSFTVIKTRNYVEPNASSTVGLLTGVYTATIALEGSYVLQNQNSRVGFYLVEPGTAVTVQPNRCYLTLPAGSSARALFFGDDLTTALNAAVTTTVSSTIYDLQGRRMNNAGQKGVFIVNGKKVIR